MILSCLAIFDIGSVSYLLQIPMQVFVESYVSHTCLSPYYRHKITKRFSWYSAMVPCSQCCFEGMGYLQYSLEDMAIS